ELARTRIQGLAGTRAGPPDRVSLLLLRRSLPRRRADHRDRPDVSFQQVVHSAPEQGESPPTCPPPFGRAGPCGWSWTLNCESRCNNRCELVCKQDHQGPARPKGGGQVGGGSPCPATGIRLPMFQRQNTRAPGGGASFLAPPNRLPQSPQLT